MDYIIQQWRCEEIGDWLWQCVSQLQIEHLSVILYGVYMIWYCRNSLAHGKQCLDIEMAALNTKDKVSTILSPSFKFRVFGDDPDCIWSIPEMGTIKINCDGSWFEESRKAGFGCVARDHNGRILGIHAGTLNGLSTSFAAEGQALLQALSWAEVEEWKVCIFEIDNCEVFRNLMCGSGSLIRRFDFITTCAWKLLQHVKWKVTLIRREANSIADNLARKACLEDWNHFASETIPGGCVE